MTAGTVFSQALERMGVSKADYAAMLKQQTSASNSPMVLKTTTLTDLDHARRQVGAQAPLADVSHPLVANVLRGAANVADKDYETLGYLASLHVFGGVDLPGPVKDKINRAFFPVDMPLLAGGELYIKTGQQVVLNSPGPVAYEKVTIEDGGALVLANTIKLSIQQLVKAAKSAGK